MPYYPGNTNMPTSMPWMWNQLPQPTMPTQYNVTSSSGQMYPNYMPGRVIQSIDLVTAQDVPMNGSPSVFVMQDGSAVYTKAWNPDGTITTLKYVPEGSKDVVQETKEVSETSRLDEILRRLDKLEKANSRNNNNNNQRKSGADRSQEVSS